MNHSYPKQAAPERGFTLIELLTVIAIIGVLAGMLLPVVASVKTKAKIAAAKVDLNNILGAINTYVTDYQRMPSSPEAVNYTANQAATGLGATCPDFTYGTFATASTTLSNSQGAQLVGIFNSGNINPPNPTWQANNSELMAILTSIDRFVNNVQSVNTNYQRNPRRINYLNAKSATANSPGIGPDGVFRDPWRNPYIITIDLNYDNKCRDAFYRNFTVSGISVTSNQGLLGTAMPGVPPFPGNEINPGNFEINGPAVGWSFGPDFKGAPGTANFNTKADAEPNKPHILSWQ
jgi:prepilin-type N-terminal cleavage/methylation domain-containing protein